MGEAKGKAEAIRMKEKLESDVGELEIGLEHSNANNLETQKAIKTYQYQIRDAAQKLADEQRAKELALDGLVAAERKAHAMQNALEEARTLLEQADRNRRSTEAELADVNEALSDTTVSNQAIAAAKRKLEAEMQTLHADMDEMSSEARLCDDKANKAMVDAARLADELRAEQEEALNLERNRTLHEAQVKDMQTKLDEADMNALKGGKKAMNKLVELVLNHFVKSWVEDAFLDFPIGRHVHTLDLLFILTPAHHKFGHLFFITFIQVKSKLLFDIQIP